MSRSLDARSTAELKLMKSAPRGADRMEAVSTWRNEQMHALRQMRMFRFGAQAKASAARKGVPQCGQMKVPKT